MTFSSQGDYYLYIVCSAYSLSPVFQFTTQFFKTPSTFSHTLFSCWVPDWTSLWFSYTGKYCSQIRFFRYSFYLELMILFCIAVSPIFWAMTFVERSSQDLAYYCRRCRIHLLRCDVQRESRWASFIVTHDRFARLLASFIVITHLRLSISIQPLSPNLDMFYAFK